ncbi:MAG TPA: AI-2E family transporter [Prolixibacteraceae bacterium]|nr:AI-2E family transporter [Prolixibacteraceae bacterium]
MINKVLKFPFYAKATFILVGLYVLIEILYHLKGIFAPLVFAMVIAIVLNPLVNFIVRFKINRIVAIIMAIFVVFLIIATVFFLLFSQISRFSESWPNLLDRSTTMFNQTIAWFSSYFDVDIENIQNWILKAKDEFQKASSALIESTLLSVGSLMLVVFLIPVYVFLFLYYKLLLRGFIYRLFGPAHESKLSEVILQTESMIQHYLVGLLIEAVIIATLNSIGLLILGIDFAIMLGIIGALVNVIPFIGGIVAVALPMLVAIATKPSGVYALYVMAVYYFIQLIDNHYIIPTIVASKVKINALFSIVIILGGNALWGISGMFLSLPILAILKIIFDHIQPLEPWGYLLGNNQETEKG